VNQTFVSATLRELQGCFAGDVPAADKMYDFYFIAFGKLSRGPIRSPDYAPIHLNRQPLLLQPKRLYQLAN
jgi:hypothetical protein